MDLPHSILRSSVKRKVLELLSKEPRTPSQLSSLLNTKLPNITTILKELSENFLIYQTNPLETRGKIYVLTEKGYSVLTEMQSQLRKSVLDNVNFSNNESDSKGKIIDTSSFSIKGIFKEFVNLGDLVSSSYTSDSDINTTIGIIVEVNKIVGAGQANGISNNSYIAKIEVLGTLVDNTKISDSTMAPIGNSIDFVTSQQLNNLIGQDSESESIAMGKTSGEPAVDINLPFSSIGNLLIIGSVGSGKNLLIRDLVSELLEKKVSIYYFTSHFDSFDSERINHISNTINIKLSDMLRDGYFNAGQDKKRFYIDSDFLDLLDNYLKVIQETNLNTIKIDKEMEHEYAHVTFDGKLISIPYREQINDNYFDFLFHDYKQIIFNTENLPSHLANAFYIWFLKKVRKYNLVERMTKIALIIDHADKLLSDKYFKNHLNDSLLSLSLEESQSLITITISDGTFEYDESFNFTNIIMSRTFSNNYDKIIKERIGEKNVQGYLYRSLGPSEYLLFLENMRFPLTFRNVTSKSYFERMRERKAMESKVIDMFRLNGFDTKNDIKLNGKSSLHHIDILAKKDGTSFFIDIKHLPKSDLMQRMIIERMVFKAVDIIKSQNEKFGIIFLGSPLNSKHEKIINCYTDFYVNYDEFNPLQLSQTFSQ
jgi:DNA-binding MarR family transcriptional regulator